MGERERIYELEQELDRFRWRDLSLDDEQPRDGELVIATDGEARWMDIHSPGLDIPMTFFDSRRHVATHWHPILEIPKRLRK